MEVFPQVLINVEVKQKPEIAAISDITCAIKNAEEEQRDQGRVFVRDSGTHPICRVMVEGPSKDKTQNIAEKIANVVRQKLT